LHSLGLVILVLRHVTGPACGRFTAWISTSKAARARGRRSGSAGFGPRRRHPRSKPRCMRRGFVSIMTT
jgi:hypothetical protein